ncbi:MAG: gamma-glutamyl-gamma-aminobutyrate hydrolase family protein [Pseudomonadota bacterium]
MSIARSKFVLLALPVYVCLLCWTDLPRLGAAEPQSGSMAARPWLMVSLAPGGASGGCRHVFSVITSLSSNPNGRILHFNEVTSELVRDMDPEFIVLSPQGTPWCRYGGQRGVALQNFLWALPFAAEELNIPILGICGGHQAIALAFGGKVGPIRAGEDDCMPYTRERQSGMTRVDQTAADPLFRGLDNDFKILESHFDEVKVLPPGFVLLASESFSPNQIMRHPSRPVYGIQGHPERFHGACPDGGVLLRNFVEIARLHNRTLRGISSSTSTSGEGRRLAASGKENR